MGRGCEGARWLKSFIQNWNVLALGCNTMVRCHRNPPTIYLTEAGIFKCWVEWEHWSPTRWQQLTNILVAWPSDRPHNHRSAVTVVLETSKSTSEAKIWKQRRKHIDIGIGSRKRNYSEEGVSTPNDPKITSVSELQDEDIKNLPEKKYQKKKKIIMKIFRDNEKLWKELKGFKN